MKKRRLLHSLTGYHSQSWLAVAEIAWTKSTPNSLENIKQTNQEHKCGKICYACRI